MDKIKIKFSEGNCDYCFRVPTDFNWFEMSRHIKKTQCELSEYIIYNNGRVIFDIFIFFGKEKIVCDILSEEQNNLKKIFIKKIVQHEGITPVSCAFAKYLKVSLEDAMNAYDNDRILYENNFGFIDADTDNPYDILGISEKEYTKDELLKIVEKRINNILDAYNSIIKQKLLKK